MVPVSGAKPLAGSSVVILIVQSQILIAEGYPLDSDEVGIRSQKDIQMRGNAIQCRITTEDPANAGVNSITFWCLL